MKKAGAMIMAVVAALTLVSTQAHAQAGAGISGITNIIGNIDESVDLFSDSKIELRLGGVYSQNENKAAEVLAVSYWGLPVKNLGVGAELISFTSTTAAAFPYVEYRHVLGNVAGGVFLGGGYDFDVQRGMGVAGLRVYYQNSKHLGVWASVSYEYSGSKEDRGLISGGGISYRF